jgi:hypothetical protein
VLSRRNRALAGWVLLFVFMCSVWGGGLKADFQISRPPKGVDPAKWFRGMDVYDTDFAWYCLLYAFYGLVDATWQTFAYWLMGALSNDPRKLAYFAGFYKGIQSAGAAVVWGIDTGNASYRSLFGSSWGLCIFGMICALPVIWLRVKETEVSEGEYEDGHKSPNTSQAVASADRDRKEEKDGEM